MTQAVIFDIDGTLADTEELHRQAFNEAFFACGVDWRWGPALYAELLQITGGKERIANYISRQQVPAAERGRLLRLIPQMHAAKTGVGAFERNGRMQVCYDGELFRRVLAMGTAAEVQSHPDVVAAYLGA